MKRIWEPGLNKFIIITLITLALVGIFTPEEYMQDNEARFFTWFGILALIGFIILSYFKDRPGR